MTRLLTRLLAVLWLSWAAGALSAQISLDSLTGGGSSEAASDTAEPAKTEEPPADPGPDATAALAAARKALAAAVPSLDAWTQLAARTEQALAEPAPNELRLRRLREEVFSWRDRFMALTSMNSGAIETLRAQVAALTPANADTAIAPAIQARIDELNKALDTARAPGLLAAANYAQANALMTRITSQMRTEDTQRLTERGASPLDPSSWRDAATAMTAALSALGSGGGLDWSTRLADDDGRFDLALAVLAMVASLLLVLRSPRWIGIAQSKVETGHARLRATWALLLSFLQVALPLVGISALILSLSLFGVLPGNSSPVTQAIFDAGLIVIATRWLAGQLGPGQTRRQLLDYPPEVFGPARRAGMTLAACIALFLVISAVLRDSGASQAALSVVGLPIVIVACAALWRFGSLLRTPPEGEGERGRVRHAVALICTVVAVGTPLLAILGYNHAARVLFAPFVLTLGIVGIFVVLQARLTRVFSADPEGDSGSLVPILVGTALFFLLLPVTALIWGASTVDLLEVWAQFRAGFTVGETTISPSDFLTFAIVFAIGYIGTRFLQRSLKSTVLPRTRLDLGGQNAVVSGVGYIGITLAALIAITLAGINLSSLAIVAGALSVGIGFGLQTIVQNFVSGIILLIERPIGEGDMIEVNGQVGFVRDISVRSTRIETFDRTDVIIPNADLVSGQVTNWTRGNLVGRLILPVGVAYGSDIEAVKEVLLQVGRDHPMVIFDPEPQALFVGFGASSLDFELRVILRDVNWKMIVTNEMNSAIDAEFRKRGIEVPFPQTDIWFRSPMPQAEAPASDTPQPPEQPAQTRDSHPEGLMTGSDLTDRADDDPDPDGTST